eukprot:TRINITY_DN1932_c0_g1_i1.p1 TRINITY_DN1932_c0_g1~~TRINITY_DN1932_c0_g1_i1.p1  ORF type:complete len:122 (-),score=30.67 TRINITY_DN1932_c0_g1_i1:125-490(-)
MTHPHAMLICSAVQQILAVSWTDVSVLDFTDVIRQLAGQSFVTRTLQSRLFITNPGSLARLSRPDLAQQVAVASSVISQQSSTLAFSSDGRDQNVETKMAAINSPSTTWPVPRQHCTAALI